MNTITQGSNPGEDHGGFSSAIFRNAPVQAGVGVSAITLVAQVFARAEVQSVVPVPAIAVALITALLLAVHNVLFLQNASKGESVILVPLSAIILFAMALGANNLVGSQTGSNEDLLANDEALRAIQEEQQRLKSQLQARTAASQPSYPVFTNPPDAPPAVADNTNAVPEPKFRGMPVDTSAQPTATAQPKETEAQKQERKRLEELKLQERMLREQRARLLKKKQSLWKVW